MSRRDLNHRGKLSPKEAAQIKDSILGIMSDLTDDHEGKLAPISFYDIQLRLKQNYDVFVTFRQAGYYTNQLVHEGRLEKELHNTDRTARHWSDQFSYYRFIQQPPEQKGPARTPPLEPHPGRPGQGNGSDIHPE